MLRYMNSTDAKKVLRRFLLALFLCVLVSIMWFLLSKTTVQPFQQLNMYYTSTNIEENYSRKVTEKERLIQQTNTGTRQKVWIKRAEELRAGCEINQTRVAMSRQSGQNVDVYATRLVVNDRYKFLFCQVPKAASTNILRILLVLDGKITMEKATRLQKVHETAQTFLRHLSTYSNHGRDFRLNNYKKVIFVREPLERLVSAYRNRFRRSNVTFPAFVQYLQDLSIKKNAYYDVHWRTEFDLCFPCKLSYDIIGKYETLDRDMRLFLKEVGANDIKLLERSKIYDHQKSSDVMLDHYRQITPAQMKFLQNFYYVDSVLYGYKFPTNLSGRV